MVPSPNRSPASRPFVGACTSGVQVPAPATDTRNIRRVTFLLVEVMCDLFTLRINCRTYPGANDGVVLDEQTRHRVCHVGKRLLWGLQSAERNDTVKHSKDQTGVAFARLQQLIPKA